MSPVVLLRGTSNSQSMFHDNGQNLVSVDGWNGGQGATRHLIPANWSSRHHSLTVQSSEAESMRVALALKAMEQMRSCAQKNVLRSESATRPAACTCTVWDWPDGL